MATSNSEVKPSDNSKDLTNDAGQEEDIDSQEEARQVMAENLIKVLEDELEELEETVDEMKRGRSEGDTILGQVAKAKESIDYLKWHVEALAGAVLN